MQAGTNGCSSPFVTDSEKFMFGLIPKVLIGVVNAIMPEVGLRVRVRANHATPP